MRVGGAFALLICSVAEGYLTQGHFRGLDAASWARGGRQGLICRPETGAGVGLAHGAYASTRGRSARWPLGAATQNPVEYSLTADEASWGKANQDGGCSVEAAMYCNLMGATDIACVITSYMEECNGNGKKLPQPAADVLRSLLSHQVGAQGFWTTFLTDPELVKSTQSPFDPGLLSAMSRFPELNMGVLSSCLAMSATEETVYSQDDDEMMRDNAAISRMRVLKLLAAVTRQPSASEGEHGYSWLLDLVDYELLQQCMETAEQRGNDVSAGALEPAIGIFSEMPRRNAKKRDSMSAAVAAVHQSMQQSYSGSKGGGDGVSSGSGQSPGGGGKQDAGAELQDTLAGFGKAIEGTWGNFLSFGKKDGKK